MGGPRISFKAWKSIKIGISGGRARSAVSLMDSAFVSSVTCSLQSKRRSILGFLAVFLDTGIRKITTRKQHKEIFRKVHENEFKASFTKILSN